MAKAPDIFKDCPFPEVAESLSPYIKSRQDVAQIRQGLHATLPLPPTLDSQSLRLEEIDPSTLTGVRKAYWRALQAHIAAQTKYDSLNSDIEGLLHQSSQHHLPSEESTTFLAESYVPLLLQKEKYRKLSVVSKTYAKINVAGGDTIGDTFDKVAKRKLGELPVPPSISTFPEREGGFGSEYDLTGLKKAILSAKQQVDEYERTASSVQGAGSHDVDPHADIRGVQRAHSELTNWMENQLTLISNVDAAEGRDDSTASLSRSNGNGVDSTYEIERLYEKEYLEARKRLLATVASSGSASEERIDELGVPRRGSETYEVDQRVTASETLVPHLPEMLVTKQYEESLLQHGAYTRRQLTAAESQTQAVLLRLADESHLVEPDLKREAPHGKDWTKAAKEARETTSEFALRRLNSGNASAEAASKILETVRGMPTSVDAFLE